MRALPGLMLWAWERSEDLRRLSPDVGVAFLAQTITLHDNRVAVDRRRQPLQISPSTAIVATTRVEAPGLDGRPLTDDQATEVARLIQRTSHLPRVAAVQIDFDATLSQRSFYRTLIAALRRELPPAVPISITALASWCVEDRWLHELDVDEIVPAIFRMGPSNERFRKLGAGSAWPETRCRGAIGTSLDEPTALDRVPGRVYVFSPRPWDSPAITAARLVRK